MPKKPTQILDPDPRNIHVDAEDKSPINAEAELDEIIHQDELDNDSDEEQSDSDGQSEG